MKGGVGVGSSGVGLEEEGSGVEGESEEGRPRVERGVKEGSP